MTLRKLLTVAALALLAFALGGVRPASGFTHVVRDDDTLASIAERYYGKIQYERILVAANLLDLEGGSSIVRGMRLEVPALGHRVVRRRPRDRDPRALSAQARRPAAGAAGRGPRVGGR